MTDREALTRAVCEAPADDLPRLVLADWLDEHAGETVCPKCGGRSEVGWLDHRRCPTCSGTGRVPDGVAARAEFVRVQVELARLRGRQDTLGRRIGHTNATRIRSLMGRERELWEAKSGGGWSLFPDRPMGEHSIYAIPGEALAAPDARPTDPVLVVRRGFVEQVTGPADAFLRHAAALFAAHPITEVRLTDREPYYNAADCRPWICATNCWLWMCTTNPQQTTRYGPAVLPRAVFDLLDGDIESANRSHWRTYPTPDAALSALSAACVSYGRRLAGLSPLIPVQPGEAVG